VGGRSTGGVSSEGLTSLLAWFGRIDVGISGILDSGPVGKRKTSRIFARV
jgi:hypothetical protein